MSAKSQIPVPQPSGLNLENIGDLSSLLETDTAGSTGPIALPLDQIDEDPNQPRTADNPGFSTASLKELAETIRLRGVKSPISVRINSEIPGRYIINHGARRYRSSKMAGKTTIPAFIDNDYNESDQVIENLQRNDLSPREIADFIGRELAKGIKKNAIAKAIGKSPAFVTQHVTLLDLPEPIADAFSAGRLQDVTAINDIVKLYKRHPDDITGWLADEAQELTRGAVKMLGDYLNEKENEEDDNPGSEGEAAHKPPKKTPRQTDPSKLKKAIVRVQHDGRSARLVLDRRPTTDASAWLEYEDDGQTLEAELTSVQLVAILGG